jgi:hypothetical protein
MIEPSGKWWKMVEGIFWKVVEGDGKSWNIMECHMI